MSGTYSIPIMDTNRALFCKLIPMIKLSEKLDDYMAGKKLLSEIVETCVEAKEKVKRLEYRIKTMQDVIDYNEDIVSEALGMMEVWDNDEAFRHLQECYAIWDDGLYEAMEEADEEESDLSD